MGDGVPQNWPIFCTQNTITNGHFIGRKMEKNIANQVTLREKKAFCPMARVPAGRSVGRPAGPHPINCRFNVSKRLPTLSIAHISYSALSLKGRGYNGRFWAISGGRDAKKMGDEMCVLKIESGEQSKIWATGYKWPFFGYFRWPRC